MRQNKTNLKYKAGPIRFSRHIKCAVDRVIPGDDWGQGGLDMRTYWLKIKDGYSFVVLDLRKYFYS